MKSATEMLAMLAGRQSTKVERQRAYIRAAFPNAVALADQFRHMGATLKYANEGGREIGKPMEKGMDWFQTMPYRSGK